MSIKQACYLEIWVFWLFCGSWELCDSWIAFVIFLGMLPVRRRAPSLCGGSLSLPRENTEWKAIVPEVSRSYLYGKSKYLRTHLRFRKEAKRLLPSSQNDKVCKLHFIWVPAQSLPTVLKKKRNTLLTLFCTLYFSINNWWVFPFSAHRSTSFA